LEKSRRAAKSKVVDSVHGTATTFSEGGVSLSMSQNVVSKIMEVFTGGVPAPKPVEPSDKPVEPSDKKEQTDEKDVHQLDRWLEECYAGRHRSKWTSKMVAPLEKMLQSEVAAERVAAAMDLAPLGKAAEATPVLLDAVRASPNLIGTASNVLPWLCLKQRLDVFDALHSMAPNAEARAELIREFSEEPDFRHRFIGDILCYLAAVRWARSRAVDTCLCRSPPVLLGGGFLMPRVFLRNRWIGT